MSERICRHDSHSSRVIGFPYHLDSYIKLSRDPISELGRQLVRQIKALSLNDPLSTPNSSIVLIGYDIGGLIVKHVSGVDSRPDSLPLII